MAGPQTLAEIHAMSSIYEQIIPDEIETDAEGNVLGSDAYYQNMHGFDLMGTPNEELTKEFEAEDKADPEGVDEREGNPPGTEELRQLLETLFNRGEF